MFIDPMVCCPSVEFSFLVGREVFEEVREIDGTFRALFELYVQEKKYFYFLAGTQLSSYTLKHI